MKHSLKVLSLSIPLSFVLGFGLTYYFEQKRKNPDFLKPSVTLLTAKTLDFKSVVNRWQQQIDFAIKVVECDSPKDCKDKVSSSIDIAILPSSLIKALVANDQLSGIPKEMISLKSQLHVDFQRPFFDPETRHSLPLFWNVNGYLCPKSKCERLDTDSLSSFEQKDREEIFFVNDQIEHSHLVKSGLWEKALAVSTEKRLEILKQDNQPIVQWPSGAITQKQIYQLGDYQYSLPRFGTTISVYALVFPKQQTKSQLQVDFASQLFDAKFLELVMEVLPAATTVKFPKETKRVDIRKRPHFLRTFELYKLKFENASS